MHSPTVTKRSKASTPGPAEIELPAAIYPPAFRRIALPLYRAGGAAGWFARGARAWITFKPGSRPRRTARNIVLKLVRFVLAQPFLASIMRRVLRRLPMPKLAALLAAVGRPDGDFTEREQFIHVRLKAALEKRAD